MPDGSPVTLTATDVLRPLEIALRALAWSMVVLAVGLVIAD